MKRMLMMMVAAVCAVQAMAAGGGADVVHVWADAVGNNDGSDWANAFVSVEDGFAALDSTRTNLWIAEGEYTLTMPAVIAGDYTIFGGFDGTESSPEERMTDATGRAVNPTVIRGGPFSFTLNVDEGALDNVVFTGFNTVPTFMRNGTGDFALSHFTFTNNTAPFIGVYRGFIAFSGSGGSVTMTRCVVSDNISHSWDLNDFGIQVGGGVGLSVFDSDISRNRGTMPLAHAARSASASAFTARRCSSSARGSARMRLAPTTPKAAPPSNCRARPAPRSATVSSTATG